MIAPQTIIAASLNLEPDRAAIARDVYRATSRGISNLLINENMVDLAMKEVRQSGVDLRVSGIVGFPIGQWNWAAKKVAIDELCEIQNGPTAVMHAVGPWLDNSVFSTEEMESLAATSGDKWVMTSLSSIPDNRLETFADDIARTGASLLILSNGVCASGLPLPDTQQVAALARQARGRFKLAAMSPTGTDETAILKYLEAGADKVVCADFWALTQAP